jgi:predicted dehydrogenase
MWCALLSFFLLTGFASFAEAQAGSTNSVAPLRIGIVGLVHGHVEGFFAHNLQRTDVQIVGIAEPDQQLFARYAKQFSLDPKLSYTSVETMLEQARPQAVLVYTNTYDHRSVVETCARHGVHVMMEKPLAVSYDDARAIEAAAQRGHIHVLVNYETTWYRSNHAAYEFVRDGSLGDVRKIVVHDGHRGPKEINVAPEFLAWLTDPKLNGAGALFDFGCYGADLATWLMSGHRPQSVTAVAQTIKPDVYPRVDDEATIILKYPQAQAIIQASWNWPFDRKDMEVYGKSGYVLTVARDDLRVRRPGGEEQHLPGPALPPPYDDPLSEFRAVVLQGAKPDGLTSLETNIIVMQILDAARRSAASGHTITLTQ